MSNSSTPSTPIPIYTDDDGNIIVNFGGQSKAQQIMAKESRRIIDTNTEYPTGIDLASGYPKQLIWTTRDGRRIAIPNMSDSHLMNTLTWMRKQIPRWKKQTIIQVMLRQTTRIMMFDYDIPEDVIEEQAQAFEEAAKEFKALDDDVFLERYVPIYGRMYQEAYKRRLILSESPTIKQKRPRPTEIGRRYKKHIGPEKPPTEDELIDSMLNLAEETNGIEVHREDWEIAEKAAKKYPQKLALGSARGPHGDWRRLYYYRGDPNPDRINNF